MLSLLRTQLSLLPNGTDSFHSLSHYRTCIEKKVVVENIVEIICIVFVVLIMSKAEFLMQNGSKTCLVLHSKRIRDGKDSLMLQHAKFNNCESYSSFISSNS